MPSDFNERIHDPDFDLFGRHLVAASAGTGKTYNIQNVYARLVMEKGLTVRQILVVTFTKAATAELRERIRSVLQELRDLFPVLEREAAESAAPPDGEAPGRRQARELAALLPPDERPRARLAVQSALLDFDLAEISTIDGFCGRALRRHAFESGFSFAAGTPAAVKLEQLVRAARDWWRRTVVRHQGEDWARYGDTAGRPDFTLEGLNGHLKALCNRHDVELALPPDDASVPGTLLRVAHGLVEARNAPAARQAREELDFSDILLGMRDALRDGDAGEAFARTLREEYKAALIDEFQDTDPVQYEIFQRIFFPAGRAGAETVKPPVFFVGDPKQAIYAFRGGDIYAYRRAATARGMEADERNHVLSANFRSTAGVVGAVNGLFRDPGPGQFTFGDPTIPYPGTLEARSGKPAFEGDPDGAAVRFVVPAPRAIGNQGELFALCTGRIAALLSDDRPILALAEGEPKRRVLPKDVAVLVSTNDDGREIRDGLGRLGVPAVLRADETVFASDERKELSFLLAAMAEPGDAKLVRTALLTPFFFLPPAAVQDLSADRAVPVPAGAFPFLGGAGEASMPDFLQLFRELEARWAGHGFLAAFDLLEERVAFRARLAARPEGERKLTNLLHLAELLQGAAASVGTAPAAQRDWFAGEAAAALGDEKELRLETEADAVQILTIHKSKGLEFPVVVLPDAWRSGHVSDPFFFHRQPADASPPPGETEPRWTLCASVDQGQLDKGRAEDEEQQETMRRLYVAMTRASHYCLAFAVGGRMRTKPSEPFMTILGRARAGVPGVAVETVDAVDAAVAYAPPPSGDAPLVDAPPPLPPIPPPLGRGSFTRLAPEGHGGPPPDERGAADYDGGDSKDYDEGEEAGDDAPAPAAGEPGNPIFGFPAGKVAGLCWHATLQTVPFDADDAAVEAVARDRLAEWRLVDGRSADRDAARLSATVRMVRRTLDLPMSAPDGTAFRLRDVPGADRLAEWNFDFSSRTAGRTTSGIVDVLRKHWGGEPDGSPHRLFLEAAAGWDNPIPKGFFDGDVDLLFRHGGYHYVVDWKSNVLGGTPESFDAAGLAREMAAKFYFFQYLLYAVAVHRFLGETVPGYDWGRNFGGIRYVFLRGVATDRGDAAVFADRPSLPLLEDLAAVLGL